MWLLFNPKYVGEGYEREKTKIIVPIRSYLTHNWKFKKNSNKIRKSNKYPYGFISSQNRLEKAVNGRKWKLSFHFVLNRRVIENLKKIATKFKKLKNTTMASFQPKIGWKMMRRRENKNYPFVSSLPDASHKIPKK